MHDALLEIDERAARARRRASGPPDGAGPRPRDHGQLPGRHAALLPGAARAGRLPGAGARDAHGQRRPALRPGDLRGGGPGRATPPCAGCASRASTRSCSRGTRAGRRWPRASPRCTTSPTSRGLVCLANPWGLPQSMRRRADRFGATPGLRGAHRAGARGDRRRPRRPRARPPVRGRGQPRPEPAPVRQRGLHLPHLVALARPRRDVGDGPPPDRRRWPRPILLVQGTADEVVELRRGRGARAGRPRGRQPRRDGRAHRGRRPLLRRAARSPRWTRSSPGCGGGPEWRGWSQRGGRAPPRSSAPTTGRSAIDLVVAQTEDGQRWDGMIFRPGRASPRRRLAVLVVHGSVGQLRHRRPAAGLVRPRQRRLHRDVGQHPHGQLRRHLRRRADAPHPARPRRRPGVLRRRGFRRIVLLGFSLGATMVTHYQALRRPPDVVGVCTLAHPASLPAALRLRWDYYDSEPDLRRGRRRGPPAPRPRLRVARARPHLRGAAGARVRRPARSTARSGPTAPGGSRAARGRRTPSRGCASARSRCRSRSSRPARTSSCAAARAPQLEGLARQGDCPSVARETIPGADHVFTGRDDELTEAVVALARRAPLSPRAARPPGVLFYCPSNNRARADDSRRLRTVITARMTITSTTIRRTYYTLLLGNTLAASLIWGINTIFLLDAGLSNLEAFAANAFFTAGHGAVRGADRDRGRRLRAPAVVPARDGDPGGHHRPLRAALAGRGRLLAVGRRLAAARPGLHLLLRARPRPGWSTRSAPPGTTGPSSRSSPAARSSRASGC